jgi:isopentenyl-diphosphate delta-isomerase
MCPVFVATTTDECRAAPDEVADHAWVDWQEFRSGVLDGTWSVSPWCVEQVVALAALSEHSWAAASWPAADPALLPPAAHPR